MDFTFNILTIVGLILSGIVYMLPTLVGWRYRDVNIVSLFIVNVFLGLTYIGWVIALAYACKGKPVPFFNKYFIDKE